MEQRDFFISYTNADEAWAVWIANVLKSNGYTVYIQALDIKPGDNFVEKMNEFLKHSRNFIAVWSKAYPESRFCMAELQSAFYAWNKETMAFLLPVRIDNHPLEPLYAGLVYIDLPDMDAASETKLINAVRYAVPRPVTITTTNNPVPSPVAPQETLPQKDDKTLAFTIIHSVAPQEDAETLFQRGLNYYRGKNGVEQDCAKAWEYFEQAASKGKAEAFLALGELSYWGDGVERDYVKSKEYYEQAAAKGNAVALSTLGSIYENGDGVNVDYAKALEYYQKAADAGYKDASVLAERVRKKMRR